MPKIKVRIEIEEEINISNEVYKDLRYYNPGKASAEEVRDWCKACDAIEEQTGYEFALRGTGIREVVDLNGDTLARA